MIWNAFYKILATVPDGGASNDSESDAGESHNRDSANMICKQYNKNYLLYRDEVNKNTGMYVLPMFTQSC